MPKFDADQSTDPLFSVPTKKFQNRLSTPKSAYWIAGEGIPIAITGAALVWLAAKATAETSD